MNDFNVKGVVYDDLHWSGNLGLNISKTVGDIEARFQWATDRKWPMIRRIVK